jgi:hypothetical protein
MDLNDGKKFQMMRVIVKPRESFQLGHGITTIHNDSG